jgi:hypothetical protein
MSAALNIDEDLPAEMIRIEARVGVASGAETIWAIR